jgi:hypothetical protein
MVIIIVEIKSFSRRTSCVFFNVFSLRYVDGLFSVMGTGIKNLGDR